MSASTEIIERIKKLLRLARSSNPHESAQALRRAMELAAEHDVAINSLNPDETAKEKKVTHKDSKTFTRLSYDQRYAAAILKSFFRVSIVEVGAIHIIDGWPRSGVKFMFVGTASDIEIALYVYDFVTFQFAHCWRKFKGRLRNRQAYVYGMFQGIVSNLFEKMPVPDSPEAKGNELVLSERRNYITAVIGETRKSDMSAPDRLAAAAANAGWVQGKKTHINSALKTSPETTLAIE